METENMYLTREVLFEKAPFFVQGIISTAIYKVRKGKLSKFNVLNQGVDYIEECIDEGCYIIIEGDYKGYCILRSACEKI